jgi:hypothetical protein
VPAVLTGVTNATSESLNRLAKLEARQAYGFRNPLNQSLGRIEEPGEDAMAAVIGESARRPGHQTPRRTSVLARHRRPAKNTDRRAERRSCAREPGAG